MEPDDEPIVEPNQDWSLNTTRRIVLAAVAGVVGLLSAMAAGIPIVGFLLAPVLRRSPDKWLDVGPVSQFTENQTHVIHVPNPGATKWDGLSDRVAAYVRRGEGEEITVFAVDCTHLGCPVSWFPQSGLFLCPCHGGTYYQDGARAAGPPPRGLYKYEHKVVNGRLLVFGGHLPTLHNPMSSSASKT